MLFRVWLLVLCLTNGAHSVRTSKEMSSIMPDAPRPEAEAADRLAASVFSQHPDLLATWTDLHNETQRLLELRRVVHTVLISVGEAAIEMTKANRASKNSEQISADLQSDNIEFKDWRLVQFLPQTAKSFEVEEWALIYKWIFSFGEFHLVWM